MDTTGIREIINKAKLNIKTMEKAVKEEHKTIASYGNMIGNSQYNDESLQIGIEQAKDNIKKFEKVMMQERATILEHRQILKILDKKQRKANNAQNNIKIDRDDGED